MKPADSASGSIAPPALLAEAARCLRTAQVASPEADARLLLAYALGVDLAGLVTITSVDVQHQMAFADLVERRSRRIPVQHLTGRAYFRHVELSVGPGVFVPRPETEVMTGEAIAELHLLTASGKTPEVVELGTGSGAIAKAIADEARGCRIHAVELSEDAIGWAARNLAGTGVDLRQGDMADAFEDLNGQVDLVIANPPYIPLDAYESVAIEAREHDPALALFSGADGLDALRVVAGVGARLLRPGGLLLAEHAEVQAESAPAVIVASGAYGHVEDHRDLTGRPRFVMARRHQLAGWVG